MPQASAAQRQPDGHDAAMAARLQAGDSAVFPELYRRLAPGLFSMVYEILRDQREAEDALQDAFLHIWKKAATYDPARSSLFTWAVMIARHRAIDRIRARQRYARATDAAAAEAEVIAPMAAAERADAAAERQDECIRIQSALAQLPDGQREALDLAFFNGMTHHEISARIGAPLGTVKARIRRGLLALRETLTKSVS